MKKITVLITLLCATAVFAAPAPSKKSNLNVADSASQTQSSGDTTTTTPASDGSSTNSSAPTDDSGN